MTTATTTLPHWTWDDLEAAMSHFEMGTQAARATRTYLMEGVREQATALSAHDLLKEILSVALVVGSVAASATHPRPRGDLQGSSSSFCSPS